MDIPEKPGSGPNTLPVDGCPEPALTMGARNGRCYGFPRLPRTRRPGWHLHRPHGGRHSRASVLVQGSLGSRRVCVPRRNAAETVTRLRARSGGPAPAAPGLHGSSAGVGGAPSSLGDWAHSSVPPARARGLGSHRPLAPDAESAFIIYVLVLLRPCDDFINLKKFFSITVDYNIILVSVCGIVVGCLYNLRHDHYDKSRTHT